MPREGMMITFLIGLKKLTIAGDHLFDVSMDKRQWFSESCHGQPQTTAHTHMGSCVMRAAAVGVSYIIGVPEGIL
jgi:hypothetical protein